MLPNYDGLKVLVTGADGFIGSHLAETLVEAGADVTALCLYNSFDSYGWLDEAPMPIFMAMRRIRGDVRDAAFMRRITEGQDVVFHLAALIAIPYSYEAPQSYVETNVLGTLNVLEAARADDVGRVVHTSTSEVYGTAQRLPIDESHPLQGQSPYSASKIGADMIAEAFSRSYGMPVAILRPFNAFGPRQSERAIIPTIIRQLLDPTCMVLKVGDTTTKRDFTFVDDTVSAFMTLGNSRTIRFGVPYNAGSGSSISIGDLIELLSDVVGRTKPVVEEGQRLRPGNSEVRVLLADSTRLLAEGGWRPAISLRCGLERTADWWSERIANHRVRRDSTFMA
ncbi:MAG: SDR family NAD(P)-dependent oxidoreductase [Devosia sp.]|nr:SDR family NAD(P)-dependent oxidoreductase [Devosia sp.]